MLWGALMTGGVTAATSRRDLESNFMEYLRKEMKVDKEKRECHSSQEDKQVIKFSEKENNKRILTRSPPQQ